MLLEFKLSLTQRAKALVSDDRIESLVQEAAEIAQQNHVHPVDVEVLCKDDVIIAVSLHHRQIHIMTDQEAAERGLTDSSRYERN